MHSIDKTWSPCSSVVLLLLPKTIVDLSLRHQVKGFPEDFPGVFFLEMSEAPKVPPKKRKPPAGMRAPEAASATKNQAEIAAAQIAAAAEAARARLHADKVRALKQKLGEHEVAASRAVPGAPPYTTKELGVLAKDWLSYTEPASGESDRCRSFEQHGYCTSATKCKYKHVCELRVFSVDERRAEIVEVRKLVAFRFVVKINQQVTRAELEAIKDRNRLKLSQRNKRKDEQRAQRWPANLISCCL